MIRIKHLLPIILISLSASQISNAQRRSTNVESLQSSIDNAQFTVKLDRSKLPYIKGSPYINETFEVLKLKSFGDKIFTGRYDANLGEMQIKRDTDTIALKNSENFEITFVLSNKVYKTHGFTNKEGLSKRGFLVVLKETDSLAVLKEELVKFYDKKPSTNGYDKAKPAEYKRLNDVYYFRLRDKISLLPQRRKDFLMLFPEHSNDLKTFIKKRGISLKNDDDLTILFEYIETL